MIEAFLRGRTGNNFFEYAAARYLAKTMGTEVRLNCMLLHPREYGPCRSALERLPIKAKIVKGGFYSMHANRVWLHFMPLEKTIPLLHQKYYIEKELKYDPALLEQAGKDFHIAGFFQTPLYFPGMRSELQEELDVRQLPIDEATGTYLDMMKDCNSVACHIRRTDYLSIPGADICKDSYYNRAMQMMREQEDKPVFFMFSDDPEWCKEHYRDSDIRVCDAPLSRTDPLNDLRLMASARHNIIANSSYSWWAAYLNRSGGEQRVILPSQWDRNAASVPMQEKLLPGWQLADVMD